MITEDVDSVVNDFSANTGISPNAIYLGRAECDALQAILNEQDYCINLSSEKNDRLEYKGVKVYSVNSDNHISVGISGRS